MFNEYIHAFVTEKPSDAFVFDREYLKELNREIGNARKEVPGYFYAMKITNFIELHNRMGKLCMGFIKDGCMEKEEQCSLCKETNWIGPRLGRIPKPHPDSQRKSHYMDVSETSNCGDKTKRFPDQLMSLHLVQF